MSKPISLAIVTVALLFCSSAPGAPTLTLSPPNITGAAGATVGWGFTLNNDTSDYLLVDASYFCQPAQDPQFTTCTQAQGTYSDLIAADLTIVGPNGSLSEAYGLASGVGSYTILPTALPGAVDSGTLFLTYMEFNGDPLTGGTQVTGDIEASATASVDVAAVVPEPAGLGLAAIGVLALIVRRRRQ